MSRDGPGHSSTQILGYPVQINSTMETRVRIIVKPEFFLSFGRHVVILYYTKDYYTRLLYVPQIYNQTSLYGPVASDAIVGPTSQVCSSHILLLPIVRNRKVQFYSRSQLHNIHTKFHPNPFRGSRVESSGRIDMISPFRVHFMHIVQTTPSSPSVRL
jgi:hypothetical protein